MPCNILHSSSYKKYISTNLNKNNHLKMSVYNENQLKKMGFNLILAVNKGKIY